jgi:hypothetical protein
MVSRFAAGPLSNLSGIIARLILARLSYRDFWCATATK